MENLIEYKTILFGFTDRFSDKRIMAFKNGDSKESLSDGSFNAGEIGIEFIIYKGDLYLLVSTDSLGRLLRLDKVNTGTTDTWIEVLSTTDLDEKCSCIVYSGDSLYIIGSSTLWEYDGDTLSSIDSLPYGLDVYCALYINNSIYIYGKVIDYSSEDFQVVYKYADSFEQVESYENIMDFESYYDVYGKNLLVEYKGKIYFPISDGTNIVLKCYNVSTGEIDEVMTIEDITYIVTTMYEYQGLIMIAIYDTVNDTSNVKIYVPVKYEIESVLIPGDGDVNESIKTVTSDPIITERMDSNFTLPCFNKYPIVGALKGKTNYAFKYCSRNEFYMELNDVQGLVGITLKDMLDNLCTLSDQVLTINGKNTAIVKNRDLSGLSDRLMTVANNNDYGNEYIKEIRSTEEYPNNFLKITINWSNYKWENNVPVSVGFLESLDNVFQYSSPIVNDPVTARNIAVNLIEQLSSVEQLDIVLSFSYFLENYDNISFNVNENFVYLDKDTEWKLYKIEHNIKDMSTTLLAVERKITLEEEDL